MTDAEAGANEETRTAPDGFRGWRWFGHTVDIEKGRHALKRGAVKVLAIEGREGIEPEPERLLPAQNYRNVPTVFSFMVT